MNKKKKYILFFFIVCFNLVLKSWFAGHCAYSFDEMISVKDTQLDFGHIKHEAEWDNNPPFYYYCLWVWHKLLPINELDSRLLSVVFISFGIGFIFLYTEKYFNVKTALFTTVILSFSNFLLYYSLEARTYSLILFLSAVSTLLFFKFIEKPSWQGLVLLSLLNFLLIYSHYISGIVLIVQYLIVWIYHKPQVRFFFSVQTFVILSLVFLRFTKKQFLNIAGFNHKGDFWLKTATLNDLKINFIHLFSGSLLASLFLVLFIFYLSSLFKARALPGQNELYCLFLGFGSILLLFTLGVFKSIFLDRYLIFCIPFATILICFQFTSWNKPGLLILLFISLLAVVNYKFGKEITVDYRIIANLVKQNELPGDYKLIQTKENTTLFGYYYKGESFLRYKNIDSLAQSLNIYGIDDVASLQKINLIQQKKIFLIQSFHKIKDPGNPVKEYLATTNNPVYANSFSSGIELTVFLPQKPNFNPKKNSR